MNLSFERSEIVYADLQPHQKKFYDTVKAILDLGITPTPRVVNEALGKPIHTSWNGPLCKIRTKLLQDYGYKLKSSPRGRYRWEKVK